MKIISVVGARPQFIKAAAVSKELKKEHNEILLHTGQHYDKELSKIFFEDLKIPAPKYNLGVGSGSHGVQTAKMLMGIEKIFLHEKPEFVMVYGDTNSTIAGALAAVKLQIPIAHVEAGLRSFDWRMPEEINRVLTDHMSTLLFCPTKTATRNLELEGLKKGVHNVGDVMYDILVANIRKSKRSQILKQLGLAPKSFMLATIHRQENTDLRNNLTNIVNAFSDAQELIVFPAHFRTIKFLKKYGLNKKLERSENVKVIKPVGYLDFLKLMANARKILTDSGGIQKESYILAVPCITLRENTEWLETINEGWNVLVGTDNTKLIDAIQNFKPTKRIKKLFGDGNASLKIREILDKYSF